MNKNAKAVLSLGLPIIILILAYLALTHAGSLPPALIKTMPHWPYLFLLVTAILAYRFNQSRIFYLMLTYTFIQLTASGNLVKWNNGDARFDLFYTLIGILVPINILVLGLVKERGIFSRWGWLKLSLLAGQILGIAWIITSASLDLLAIINGEFLYPMFQFIPEITPLCLLVLCLSSAVLLLQLRFTQSDFTALSLGMVLAAALLIYWRGIQLGVPIMVSSAGLMMSVFIIQNSYSMAYMDELTEIPGRRALREELMKLSGIYVIAMVDIDFFKKFNDQYGHDVGDEVLRMVAAKLDRVTGGGQAYRYGGEEFAIVFSGKDLDDALPHLEKVREAIAQSDFSIRGKNRPKKKPEVIKPAGKTKKVSVTVSIGAAEKSPRRSNAQEVLTAADKALYRAKQNGRNRVSK